MKQVILEGGLRINQLDTILTSGAISDTQEPDATVDIVSDLEKAYFDFMAKVEYKEYLTLNEILVKVLKGSFKSVNDLVETQITNGDLDQAGWNFLLKLVEFVVLEKRLDLNDKVSIQESNTRRTKLGTYFNYPTFKSTVRSSDTSDEERLALSNHRQREAEKVFSELGIDSYQVDLIDYFVTILYRDIPLTTNFIRLFFVGK